jgi:oligopeptide transport system substrate-binding protein
MSMAIDRNLLVKEVTKAGQKPGVAFVPYGSADANGKDFRANQPSYPTAPASANVAKAKQLLKESGVDLSKVSLTYKYNTAPSNKAIAEVLQAMWKAIGVDVKLENSEWAVFQSARTSGNYQIARGAWGGDYLDPMTFLDLFTKKNGNNDPKYNSLRYEGLIASAKNEANPATRMKYLHQAEDQLMTDMPIVPIFFAVTQLSNTASVKGVYELPTGIPYFDRAYRQ